MANRFEDLGAWQRADELKRLVYQVCQRPKVASDFRFVTQLRAAAASGPANIAEGFGRYRHSDFARFVRIAKASESEVLNHLRDGRDRGHISDEEFEELLVAAKRALKAAGGLIRYLDSTPDR